MRTLDVAAGNGNAPMPKKEEADTDSNTSSSDDEHENNRSVQKRSEMKVDNTSKHHPLRQSTTNSASPEDYWFEPAPPAPAPPPGAKHGKSGVFYGGHWVDMEDLQGTFYPKDGSDSTSTASCNHDCSACPRSRSRNAQAPPVLVQEQDGNSNNNNNTNNTDTVYDVVIIGAGCIGGAVARQLSQFQLKVLWLEAADDVSQGTLEL